MSVRILRNVNGKLLEVIVLDATISHELSFTKTVTRNPVEDGTTVSDHAQADPKEISVTGVITNTPVSLLSGGVIATYDPNRSRNAYKALMEIFDENELVQVQDELDVWDAMMMSSFSAPRDIATFNSLQFTATFTQVTKVGTLKVELAEDAQEIAAPQEDLGRQVPAESSDSSQARTSILASLLF